MSDPKSYKEARLQKQATKHMLEEIKLRVIRGKKREDQQLADDRARGIPSLRINNLSYLKEETIPTSDQTEIY